jgi:hypothetical protein
VASLAGLLMATLGAAPSQASAAVDNAACRPDGMYRTPGADVPYCSVYDTGGREKMGADHQRRIIGYFTGWRTGRNGDQPYLVSDVPWDKVTHLNYAFGRVGGDNKLSVGTDGPTNAATGIDFPGVPGAELDPTLPYKGHFNLLTKFKKQYPNVKTLISVGGWTETGGYFDDAGTREERRAVARPVAGSPLVPQRRRRIRQALWERDDPGHPRRRSVDQAADAACASRQRTLWPVCPDRDGVVPAPGRGVARPHRSEPGRGLPHPPRPGAGPLVPRRLLDPQRPAGHPAGRPACRGASSGWIPTPTTWPRGCWTSTATRWAHPAASTTT